MGEVWKMHWGVDYSSINQIGVVEGYDPELPVLQRLDLNVIPELLPHVVKALPCDGNTSGWKLQLTRTARREGWGEKQLKKMISRPSLA